MGGRRAAEASEIGAAIRAERQRAGLTIGRLAALAGISRPYLNNLERAAQLTTPDTLLLIANVFPDVDPVAWCWLLLRDLWGGPIAEQMRRHAIAEDGEPR